jgi:hypothetical protein
VLERSDWVIKYTGTTPPRYRLSPIWNWRKQHTWPSQNRYSASSVSTSLPCGYRSSKKKLTVYNSSLSGQGNSLHRHLWIISLLTTVQRGHLWKTVLLHVSYVTGRAICGKDLVTVRSVCYCTCCLCYCSCHMLLDVISVGKTLLLCVSSVTVRAIAPARRLLQFILVSFYGSLT